MLSSEIFGISCPTEIHFGVGVSKSIPDLLPEDCSKVVFVRGATGLAAAPILHELRRRGVDIINVRCQAEPSVDTINAALDSIGGSKVHAVLACGGGSVIDTGKAIAFAVSHGIRIPSDLAQVDSRLLKQPSKVPCFAIPTTAGTGAEVTSNVVLDFQSRGTKMSLRGRALSPHCSFVDPALTNSSPRDVTLRSGLDAVTQIIESYTSRSATPFSDTLTCPAIELGLAALKKVLEDNDVEARTDLAWVSLASGIALANSGLGAAHGMASVLGSRYNAPHGALCGRLLVPVLRRNLTLLADASAAKERVRICLGSIGKTFPPQPGQDELSGFEAWLSLKGLQRLSDWEVQPAHFAELAEMAVEASSSQKNAVIYQPKDFIKVLEEAL